jgi:hypothetical protein
MKQKDGKSKGSPSYTAAQKLAMKKAGKNRTDKYGESGSGQSKAGAVASVIPKFENDFKDSDVEIAAYGINNDDNFKKYDKRVRDTNTRANKGRISQTITGYTPREATMTEDDGSVSTLFDRDVKTYEADNKGVSATRGRQIKEKAREGMSYGKGELRANREAIRDVNREGNDSIVTAGKISRQGKEKAYKEALQATYDHSRPYNKAEKAEKNKLKKARSRGDLGRGSGASISFGYD